MKPEPEPPAVPDVAEGETEPMKTATWDGVTWDITGQQSWSDLGVANEAEYLERIRLRMRSAALRGDRADLDVAVQQAADYRGISWQESIARFIFDLLASTESTLTLEQIAESGGRDWMLTIACEVAQLLHPTSADAPSTTVN